MEASQVKVAWVSEVVSVQPRSTVWRYLLDNRTHRRTFETREQAQLEIFEYIETFLQQAAHALGARLHEPRGVRREDGEGEGIVENAAKAA